MATAADSFEDDSSRVQDTIPRIRGHRGGDLNDGRSESRAEVQNLRKWNIPLDIGRTGSPPGEMMGAATVRNCGSYRVRETSRGQVPSNGGIRCRFCSAPGSPISGHCPIRFRSIILDGGISVIWYVRSWGCFSNFDTLCTLEALPRGWKLFLIYNHQDLSHFMIRRFKLKNLIEF